MKPAWLSRVSSEDQKEAQTVQTQLEFARAFALLHQFAWVDFYTDEAVSGAVPLHLRPAGARLLADAASGRVDTVYFYGLDRLGRDARVILQAVTDLESRGCVVRSATEPFDTSTPAGRLMLTMLSGVAQFGKELQLEKMTEGARTRSRAGQWLGGPRAPYGYRIEGIRREARIVVSDDPIPGVGLSEADVIRIVFRMAAEERLTCGPIADWLNARGIPTAYADRQLIHGRTGRPITGLWSPGGVRQLLINPTYRGERQYAKQSKRPVIPQEVPALVTVATWEAAREQLRENLRRAKRNTQREYLLRGLLRCGLCGLNYQGWTGGKAHAYYVCTGKRRDRGTRDVPCPSPRLPLLATEAAVWEGVLEWARERGTFRALLASQVAPAQAEGARDKAERETLEKRLRAQEGARAGMLALYRRGRIGEADLDGQLDAIAAEEAVIRSALARLTPPPALVTPAALATLETCLDRTAVAVPATFAERRQVLETLVAWFLVHPDRTLEARLRLG